MPETYGALAVLFCASLAVGAAIAKASGRDPWSGWSGAVGFAALIIVATVAIKLPGHGVTAAVLVGLVAVGSGVYVFPVVRRPSFAVVVALGALLLLMSVPFIANERVDLVGVGINNDSALHLGWGETLSEGSEREPVPLSKGYPVGDHALFAALSEGLGVEMNRSLTAFLLVVPLLTLLAALSGLDRLSPWRRALGGVLVGGAYLASAYFAQGAFKETVEGLLLLAFVVALREVAREPLSVRGLIPLPLLLGGCFYNYSYVGLAWPLATLAVFLAPSAPRIVRGLRSRVSLDRRTLLTGLAVVALTAVVIAPELSRATQFFDQIKLSPSGEGKITRENVGNLIQDISPFELLGVWPREEFRVYYETARGAFKGGLLAAAALLAALLGAAMWLRRRDYAVPAAVGSGLLIYLYLKGAESAYVTAKSLAVLAPVTMLLIVRPLLEPLPAFARSLWLPRLGLAAVFIVGALYSSFLALRAALVWPEQHREELESIRPLVNGQSTLFLGRDHYVQWELRGSELSDRLVRWRVKPLPRPGKAAPPSRYRYRLSYDFDIAPAAELNQYRYVITTNTAFASEAPAEFSLVRRTPSFQVWRRDEEVVPRSVLGEATDPGAVLDCSTPEGRSLSRRQGWARVREAPVKAAGRLSITDVNQRARRRLALGPGEWELSVQYVSMFPIAVSADGARIGRLPPSSDQEGPFWRIGTVRLPARRTVGVTLQPLKPNVVSSEERQATFGRLVAVPTDAPRETVPLAEACGRYVDWYTLGRERPRPGRLSS